ncbi:hypothetical protein [Bartonella sp. CB175]|uniref:hypothetical protein n=1 Tax=Bartonella sp. CB175 TaxID=3112256 RepID=UPI00300E41F3
MRVWLSSQMGASAANIAISFVFLIMIIAVISAIIMFLYRLNTGSSNIRKKKRQLRLTICETIAIDRTRRLILVRRDSTEHLILIGGQTDVVVESNIGTDTNTTNKSDSKSQKATRPALTVHNKNPIQEEKIPVLANEATHTQCDVTTPLVINNPLEDSAITAEIEGRQEPSLFIPSQKK